MKHLKTFSTFIRESFGWNYPAGAANDPNAPWNQNDDDYEVVRDNDWIDGKGGEEKNLFKCMVLLLQHGMVILRHKQTGELYLISTEGDDILEYLPKKEYRTYIGRDEDGDPDYDTETEVEDLDEAGAEAFATDNFESAGQGLDDWEEGASMVKIDQDMRADLINDLARSYERTTANTKKDLDLKALKLLDSPFH